jgi:hypothetical protein
MIAVALTLGLSGAPALVAQSTRSGPAPDTPRLLVAVFQSPDLPTGVQAANAVRQRITNAVPIRQLYVIPWEQIDQYLKSSGYKSDSALGPGDLKELAKLLRADEVIMGTITKLPTGVRIEARLARSARWPKHANSWPTHVPARTASATRNCRWPLLPRGPAF